MLLLIVIVVRELVCNCSNNTYLFLYSLTTAGAPHHASHHREEGHDEMGDRVQLLALDRHWKPRTVPGLHHVRLYAVFIVSVCLLAPLSISMTCRFSPVQVRVYD